MSIELQTTQTIEPFTFWQFALNRTGEAATDLDDIRQAMRIILLTPKGSVPHRPNFAIGIYDYLDLPLNVVTNRLVAETWRALTQFEPRIDVLEVNVFPGAAPERIRIRVDFRVKVNQLQYFVEFPF